METFDWEKKKCKKEEAFDKQETKREVSEWGVKKAINA